MGLVSVRDAFRAVLAPVTGIGTVAAGVPPQLGDDRTCIVYARPGPSSTNTARGGANRGRGGRPVYVNEDNVIVEWHFKVAADDLGRGDDAALPVFDAVRDALQAQLVDGMFGGTVHAFGPVDTDHYGQMDYAADPTFGFRLVVAVVHGAEAG